MRLFCFPHAGASSTIFNEWFSAFPPEIEVCGIEPPGRFARRSEPAHQNLHDFTSALLPALRSYLDIPFALFGYSMGALMAFECARALRDHHLPEPAHLIVAAHKAPQRPTRYPAISGASEPEFIRQLEQRFGPLDPVIRTDPEMLAAVTQMMRTDLGVLERYKYRPAAPLSASILAIGGSQDAGVDATDLDSWSEQTQSSFRSAWLPGGHFFLRQHGAALRSLVQSELQPGSAPIHHASEAQRAR
jgi:surfactin synthase thioesterase subunit